MHSLFHTSQLNSAFPPISLMTFDQPYIDYHQTPRAHRLVSYFEYIMVMISIILGLGLPWRCGTSVA